MPLLLWRIPERQREYSALGLVAVEVGVTEGNWLRRADRNMHDAKAFLHCFC